MPCQQVCQICTLPPNGGWLSLLNIYFVLPRNVIIWQCMDYSYSVHIIFLTYPSYILMILSIYPCYILKLAPLDFSLFCNSGFSRLFFQSFQHPRLSVRRVYTLPDKQTAVIASSTNHVSITTGKSNICHMG